MQGMYALTSEGYNSRNILGGLAIYSVKRAESSRVGWQGGGGGQKGLWV